MNVTLPRAILFAVLIKKKHVIAVPLCYNSIFFWNLIVKCEEGAILNDLELKEIIDDLDTSKMLEIVPWIKLNKTLNDMKDFMDNVDIALKNIEGINCTKLWNERFENVIQSTKNLCNSTINILDLSIDINMNEQRKNRLQAQLEIGMMYLGAATRIKIYEQDYKNNVDRIKDPLRRLKASYDEKKAEIDSSLQQLAIDVTANLLKSVKDAAQSLFNKKIDKNAVPISDAIILSYQITPALSDAQIDINNHYNNTISSISHEFKVIEKALQEKEERKIEKILLDLNMLNFFGLPENCIEIEKFKSLKSNLEKSCSALEEI